MNPPPPRAGIEPSIRVLRKFRLIFNAVKSHFQQVEKIAGVGGAQLWALSVIQGTPGLSMKALAQAMDVHQATASNLAKSLAQAGLVYIEKDEADKRAVRLRLLPDGRAVLRRAPGPLAGVLPDALASLDPRMLERLDRDLASLIEVLQADERAAGIPLGQI